MKIVWLASYPRSGNTFLRVLLHNYLFGKTDDGRIIEERIPDLHKLSMRQATLDKNSDIACFVKTHFMYTDSHPYADDTIGFVYLLRNPRDVLLSNAKYLNATSSTEELSEFAKSFILHNGVTRWYHMKYGAWSENIASWLMQANKTSSMFIKYEELRQNTSNTLGMLIRFIGMEPDQQKLRYAVDSTTIESMRNMETKESTLGGIHLFNKPEGGEDHFVGEGRMNQSLAGISEEVEDLFLKKFGKFMTLFGYQ